MLITFANKYYRIPVTEYIDNVEELIKEQAQLWVDKNIHGKEVEIE